MSSALAILAGALCAVLGDGWCAHTEEVRREWARKLGAEAPLDRATASQ